MALLKLLHVGSATSFFGAGLMSAWWKWRADASGDLKVIAFAQRAVVLADWCVTFPSALISPVTGAWLLVRHGLSWTDPWVVVSIVSYVVAVACWLPAAFLQLLMRRLAEQSLAQGRHLPPEFHRARRTWTLLIIPVFVAAFGILCAMVGKPIG